MATPETRNEQIAPVSASEGIRPVETEHPIAADSGEAWPPIFVSNALLIGALASFLTAFIGFLTDRYAVLVVGAGAFAIVCFVWIVVATIALWKSGAMEFILRFVFRRGGAGR